MAPRIDTVVLPLDADRYAAGLLPGALHRAARLHPGAARLVVVLFGDGVAYVVECEERVEPSGELVESIQAVLDELWLEGGAA